MKCKLYTGSVLEKLENFESLRYDDQQELLRMEKISLKRPSVRSICPTPIKIKEEIKDEHDLKEEKTRELLIAKQSKQFFSHRCFLEKYPDSELQSFLTLNGCGVVMGKEKVRYYLLSLNK